MPVTLSCPSCGVTGVVSRTGRRTTFEPYAAWRRTCPLERGLAGPLQCPHLRGSFRSDPPAAEEPGPKA